MMNIDLVELTDEQRMLADLSRQIAEGFPPGYWRECEEKAEFPAEFWRAISQAGLLGLLVPEKYGGAGKGMMELVIASEEVAAHGCGYAPAYYLLLTPVFGALPIILHGTEKQKEKYLPGMASGELQACLGLTEDTTGSNTSNTKTIARKVNDDMWEIEGSKILISGVDQAGIMVAVTRTTPKDKVAKRTKGLSLFIIDLPNESVKLKNIPKHGANYCHLFEVWLDNVWIEHDALIPPQDDGFYTLFDVLDPERMVCTATAIGVAKCAINKAVEYSKDRRVFDDVPIGKYQSIQFPLAEAYASLEAAKVLNARAALLFDNHADPKTVGAITNVAKCIAVENATKAVYWAMQTFGGYGYIKEFDIERWWREINLLRLSPVSHQMTLNYIGEHILGMPRSY
jgi:acyl-CoA dehydrogenase